MPKCIRQNNYNVRISILYLHPQWPRGRLRCSPIPLSRLPPRSLPPPGRSVPACPVPRQASSGDAVRSATLVCFKSSWAISGERATQLPSLSLIFPRQSRMQRPHQFYSLKFREGHISRRIGILKKGEKNADSRTKPQRPVSKQRFKVIAQDSL